MVVVVGGLVEMASVSPGPPLAFREVREKDELPLKDLHGDCITEITYPTDFFFKATHGCEGIAGWVCTAGGEAGEERLIGFVTAQVQDASSNNVEEGIADCVLRPTLWNWAEDNKFVYVLTIGVKEEYRGRGVATRLLNEVKRFGERRCASAVYLHTIVYNHKAISFYRKNNFVCQKKLQGFYRLNDTEVHDGLLFSCSKGSDYPDSSWDQCSLVPPQLWSILQGFFQSLMKA